MDESDNGVKHLKKFLDMRILMKKQYCFDDVWLYFLEYIKSNNLGTYGK